MRWAALFAAILGVAGFTAQAQDMTDGIGGGFELIDQNGSVRTEADPEGRMQLVFFGYANCQEICSAALPLMAETVDLLAETGSRVIPVLVTVDPERDTPEALATALALHHRDFVGLTGTEVELAVAYEAFNVEFEALFVDPFYGTVFSHGSFIYLLGGDGQVLTLLPPILGPSQMAEIISTYTGAT